MKSFYYPSRRLLISFLLSASVFLNACSVLVGQVKPVEEKASATQLTPIDHISPNWKQLELHSAVSNEGADDIPDSAWQSTRSAAVISLNSACRQNRDESSELKDFTSNLLSQWRNLKIESQNNIIVSGKPALETTAEGIYLNRHRKFQTVVVKTQTCLYDLIYLSPVKTFNQELGVFHQFRDSLKLK